MKASSSIYFMALVFFIVMSGCRKPEAPEYYGFSNLQVSSVNGGNSRISANVKLFNPNPFPLKLKRAEIDVFLNDKPANHYQLDSTIDIPRKDTFYVPVTLDIDLKSLLTNAVQMILKNQVNVRLDGKATLVRSGISITRPFHYEGVQKLSDFIQPQ